MADQNNPEPSPSVTSRRRSSFAGMMDLFGQRNSNSPPNGTSPYPGPITHAAAQAQQRRLSISTVGLGTSPTGPASASPFTNIRSRGQSISSAGSGSVDESPFEDSDGPPVGNNPPSPFARRLSFGARAMRDMRTGSGGGGGNGGGGGGAGGGGNNGRPSVIHVTASDRPKPAVSPPTAKGREGFNFAENMRARAERGSVSAGVPTSPNPGMHSRAKSVAVMEPPVREMPKQPRKPDQFQERILKGDFYMD